MNKLVLTIRRIELNTILTSTWKMLTEQESLSQFKIEAIVWKQPFVVSGSENL